MEVIIVVAIAFNMIIKIILVSELELGLWLLVIANRKLFMRIRVMIRINDIIRVMVYIRVIIRVRRVRIGFEARVSMI